MTENWLTADTAFLELNDDSCIEDDTPDSLKMALDVGAIETSTPVKMLQENDSISSLEENSSDQVKHRPAFCIFVASLSSQRTDDQLCESVRTHFDAFGIILSVKVLRDPKNRPYAFVQYGSEYETSNALNLAHKSIIDGREIRCERARVNRTVLICSDRQDLRVTYRLATELGSRFGEVENITSFDGVPGGGMFIRFAFRDDAARAYACLQHDTPYRIYWVQNIANGQPGDTQNDKRQLFVGQLSNDTTEEEIHSKFSKFGAISKVEIIRKSGSPTVFAFVHYDNYLSVVQAIERANHTMWKGHTIHVQCREDRKIRPQLAPPPSHIQGHQHQASLPFSFGERTKHTNNKGKSLKWRSNNNNSGNNVANRAPLAKANAGMHVRGVENFYPMYYFETPWGMVPAGHPQHPQHPQSTRDNWMMRPTR